MAKNAKKVRSIAVPTSVAAGAATDVKDLTGLQATLAGTLSATYQFQVSYDNGTSFVNHGTALTAAGIVATAIPDAATQVRWNCTAYTSGTPTSAIAGVKDTEVFW